MADIVSASLYSSDLFVRVAPLQIFRGESIDADIALFVHGVVRRTTDIRFLCCSFFSPCDSFNSNFPIAPMRQANYSDGPCSLSRRPTPPIGTPDLDSSRHLSNRDDETLSPTLVSDWKNRITLPRYSLSLRARKGGPVQDLVAFPTKRDEVAFRVVSIGASAFHVVNVEIPERSTLLAAPTVALQHHPTEHRIKPLRRSNSRSFL